MNSEMLGLSYLQIALGKTDHLVAHINSNDKEPSWCRIKTLRGLLVE